MFRRATMTTLSALSTGSSISSSSSSVARRSISFLATPTTPPTSAGHVHAMLSPAEMESAPHGMGPVQGWNGGGSRLSPVVPTHFMRDSARRQSFSYGDRDATGTEQRFSGVHNQGRLDTEALSSPLVQHAPLPDLNRQGLSAVQAVREQHVAEGVTYMTTHREHEIDGKRTRNCVGFATEILKATTGVDLHLPMHAYPTDVVDAVNANRAVLQKGMHYMGTSDDKGHEAIPWVPTRQEAEHDARIATIQRARS